jgi:hypothetical protein
MTMSARVQHTNPWRNEYSAWYCKIINLHYLNIPSARQILKLMEQDSEFYEFWSKLIIGHTFKVFSKRRSAVGSRGPRQTQQYEFLWCTLWKEDTRNQHTSLDSEMNFGVRTHLPDLRIFYRLACLALGTQTSFDRWHYGSKERSDTPKARLSTDGRGALPSLTNGSSLLYGQQKTVSSLSKVQRHMGLHVEVTSDST